MDDRKKLTKMDKLELILLLQSLTEENDTMRATVTGLQEANARLILSTHELENERDALQAQLTALTAAEAAAEDEQPSTEETCEAVVTEDSPAPYTAEETPYGASEFSQQQPVTEISDITEEASPDAAASTPAAAVPQEQLPVGSFADAMVASAEIIQRTQQAADAYLARCRTLWEESQSEAERIVQEARERADAMIYDAETRSHAMLVQEEAARARIRDEVARLTQFVKAMDIGEGGKQDG